MTDFIPLFPLKLVVFPGENLNLHVFEPRYKQLVRDCEHNGITFGIPPYLKDKVMDFGTEMELVKIIKRNDNGTVDIKTRAIGVFKIHDYFSTALNKMYAGADIERMKIDSKGDQLLCDKIIEKARVLYDYLSIERDLPEEGTLFQTFDIAHHVGFSIDQEYQLLTLPNEIKRQQFMFEHLRKLIPIVKEMEKLRKKAEMNGHFKNIIPPV